GLGRKLRQDRLQIRHLIGRHLEVGMQTDESRKLIHTLMVNLSGMQGEARRLRQKQVRSPIRRDLRSCSSRRTISFSLRRPKTMCCRRRQTKTNENSTRMRLNGAKGMRCEPHSYFMTGGLGSRPGRSV